MSVFDGKARRSWSCMRWNDNAWDEFGQGNLSDVGQSNVFVGQFCQGRVDHMEGMCAWFAQFSCVLAKCLGLGLVCGGCNREVNYICNRFLNYASRECRIQELSYA